MTLKYRDTHKGHRVANFVDRYGISCSIQRSSINGEDCIWLGRDDPPANGNGQPLARMHLDRRLVRELLPSLIQFVNEGTLPGEPATARHDSEEAMNRWPPFEWPPQESVSRPCVSKRRGPVRSSARPRRNRSHPSGAPAT